MRVPFGLLLTSVVLCWSTTKLQADDGGESPGRSGQGLLVLYDFAESKGETVHDRSGVAPKMDLQISDAAAVRRSSGSLEVRGKVLIRSTGPATKIVDAVRRTGEISVEAWVRSANTNQDGPARIVTISLNANERNFTMGQERDRFDFRLRSTRTSKNGIPSISSPSRSVNSGLSHVVYTRARSGEVKVYVNGKPVGGGRVDGDLNSWDRKLHFALANELSNDRPWQGTYHLVAVFGRALRTAEVQRHFAAGPKASSEAVAAKPGERLFTSQVASIFARHCLECHDAATHKGGLDLSHKRRAMAGGEGGVVIVAGKSAASRLWEQVAEDAMPADRPPLAAAEKQALKAWIDAGADWSFETIDPILYAHGESARQNWIRRLTLSEYIETVRVAVDVDISKEAGELLPRDLRADGFRNTAYNLNVDLKHVEAYARLATIIVQRMDIKKFAARYSRGRRLTDDNMRGLIAKMGKWVLRGPLEEHEVTTYRGISTTVASAGGSFEDAVRYILEAMLQSPRFLYRMENQAGDGNAWPVGQYELASRISYIVWGAPPDAELMKAADAGQLDRDTVRAQVQRMLKDPRAKRRSSEFLTQWLDLGRLEDLRPDPRRFPKWNAELASDMRSETLAFFEEVVWKQQRPLAELLNAQVTFATPRLAQHYGLEAKQKSLDRYDVSSVPGRGGLLTQGSVLTVGGDDGSMVARGLFVLHNLLRGTVKDPPPCVDTTPVPTKSGLTQRGIAEARIGNASCGGCHSKFEPLAFGLERFDGLGGYRQRDEHGNPLREDGEILIPGEAKPIGYKSSAELMDLLAGSERVSECLTWKVTQFALGRPLTAADAPILAKIHRDSREQGGTYASLITAIVTSDLVLLTRTEIRP